MTSDYQKTRYSTTYMTDEMMSSLKTLVNYYNRQSGSIPTCVNVEERKLLIATICIHVLDHFYNSEAVFAFWDQLQSCNMEHLDVLHSNSCDNPLQHKNF